MSKKVFVGNLNFTVGDEDLRQAFERFGTIQESKVITDQYSGRSRGFGFITFENDGDADNAISEMDGQELNERPIRVNEAKEKSSRGGGRNFNRGGGGGGGRERW